MPDVFREAFMSLSRAAPLFTRWCLAALQRFAAYFELSAAGRSRTPVLKIRLVSDWRRRGRYRRRRLALCRRTVYCRPLVSALTVVALMPPAAFTTSRPLLRLPCRSRNMAISALSLPISFMSFHRASPYYAGPRWRGLLIIRGRADEYRP